MTIQYQTTSGLSPTMTLYSPSNAILINGGAMIEVGTTGVYEYTIMFSTVWGTGDFTVMCTEVTQGTVDGTTITVTEHDLEEVAGSISAVQATTSGITALAGLAEDLDVQIELIESALSKIESDVTSRVGNVGDTMADMEAVYNGLVRVSEQMRAMGEDTAMLEDMLDLSKDKKQDIVYLKNKAEELKAALELSRKLADEFSSQPVTEVWFEFR